jgi:DNA-binding CsgD family transcriptional regulator
VRLVGRERELADVVAHLPTADSPSRVVGFEGTAGVGKSTLLDAVGAAAEQAGVRVLRCRPTEPESQLAYAALGDLLAPVDDLTGIGSMWCSVLDRVLLRVASPRLHPGGPADIAGGADLDARSVGGACAALWRLLAADGPLVLIVDDTQWLDSASANALLFSLRRLPPHGMVVIAARRSDEPGPVLASDAVELLPLSNESVMALLGDRASAAALTARQLRSIVDASGGNPLFAIELAREAARPGLRPGRQLSVPASLDDVLLRRFGAVDDDVSDALATVALLARPDLAVIRRLGLTATIERAERDGIVDTTTGRVVFGHPLFASAVLARTTATAQRSLHRRLAAAVDDRTEAARHAACAAEEPDAELADRLAEAAASLAARGAIEHAAEFASLSARLTPATSSEHPERHVVAAHLSFQSGEADAAQRLLADVDRSAAAPPIRVRESLVRAKVEFSVGSAAIAQSHAYAALAECTTDAERMEVHSILGRISYDNFDRAAEHAFEADRLAALADVDDAVRASALVARATATLMAGGGLERRLHEEAIELEGATAGYAPDSAAASLAVLLKITDELDESRAMLLEILRSNEDDGALPFVLSHLPQLELWTGNWDAAEEYAQRHLEAAERTGQHDQVVQAHNNLAVIDIYRGDVAGAAVRAEQIRQAGIDEHDDWTERNGLGLLGLIALTEGDAERAVQLLGRWHELAERMALREPGYCRMQADYVEALVATGRLDEAAAFATMMQANATRLDRRSLSAGAARVRALIAAAGGDRDEAVRLADEAVRQFAETPLVVEHARAQLTLGQVHRRFKEKSAARAALTAALEVFERLGAERFSARARQDLARIGLRAPASDSLTETERRVAELAATGRTVRQVGDELFISPKTVEANLTRVYRKLGLSGRAELATWVATSGGRPAEPR